jgi:hypothetical protein
VACWRDNRLIASLSGSLASVLKSAAMQPKAYVPLVAIGVATRQPIVRAEVNGVPLSGTDQLHWLLMVSHDLSGG